MQIDGVLGRELRRHYLFCALSDDQRERLLAASRTRRFVAAELLFRRGDAARHFFLLRSGCVKLYRLSPEGGEKIGSCTICWRLRPQPPRGALE